MRDFKLSKTSSAFQNKNKSKKTTTKTILSKDLEPLLGRLL